MEQVKLEQLLKDKDAECKLALVNKEVECKLALANKEVEYLKREIKIKDQCSRNNVKTCNNALKFAKMHFLNPRDLDSYNCQFVEEDCPHDDIMELVDKFIHHEINDMGPNFIADMICKYFKTPNKLDQSMHNTDVQRMTFILYLKKMWSWDKKGNIVKSEIIIPFLKQMINPLHKYMEKCTKQIKSTKNSDYQTLLEYSLAASKVVTAIENELYSNKVLANLASKFYLDINDDKLLTE